MRLSRLAVVTALIAAVALLARLAPIHAETRVAPGEAKAAAGAKVGEAAPEFSLVNVTKDDETVSLDTLRGKIVVLSFDSIQCPVAAAYRERWAKLAEKYSAGGKVAFVSANPNANESSADIKAKLGTASYLVTKDEKNVAADAYGATRTPHVYVIDELGKVRYIGAIDDNMAEAKVTKKYVADALDSLLAGKEVATSSTSAVGCGIKRAKK